jgi:hypothetical protein
MMRAIPTSILLATALALAPARLPGQRPGEGAAALLLEDGSFVPGVPVGFEPERGVLLWAESGAGSPRRELRWAQVVALSGPAAQAAPEAALLRLVGGDEYRGEILGGDPAGESVLLRSAVLGERGLRIDRLQSIAFGPAGAAVLFEVPADVEEDEALFVPARRGFDLVVGMLHRFGPEGVLFEARGETQPRLRPYAALAGFALRGGEEPDAPAVTLLTTSAGDRIGVRGLGFEAGSWTFELEDGSALRLRQAEVTSLTPLGPGRRFLSDQEVIEAREHPFFDADALPLLPFRRDRSVDGGALRAGGLGFGKGLGVHARSALAWRVPEGVRALTGMVAVDDSALGLPVRGAVAVTIRQNDEVLLRIDELAAGTPPRALGRLAVRPGATLRLEVDFGPGLDLGDRVDWLGLTFLE